MTSANAPTVSDPVAVSPSTSPAQARMVPKRRSFLANTLYLGLVQGAEYLVPLIAIPFLLRVIGVESYGQIAFAQAISMYCVVLTEFGFNLTGTRLASIHHTDRDRLSPIFWEVQTSKLMLFLATAALLVALTFTVPQLRGMAVVVLCGLLPALGNVMYPLWLLQGLERMREAAMLMIFTRLTLLGCLFLFVRSPADLPLAAALQMGATPVAGILSWLLIARGRFVHWARPTLSQAWSRLGESRHTFFATAASTLYRQTNAVVLGFVAGPVAVAHYSVVEKIVKAVQEAARPLSQAAYPRVMAAAAQSRDAAIPLLRKLLLAIGGLGLCASLALLIGARPVLDFIGGHALGDATTVMYIMAVVPLIGGINSVLGVQTMMAFGYHKPFSHMVALAGVFNLLAIVPLAMTLGDRGGAISYVLSETVLLISMVLFLRAKGVRYFGKQASGS